ncbi:type II secretion system F family protein [Methylobacterium marchantiae]|uniref:Type II secretion system F family protein n=1 Tax=Methylobacterium marchantiae TaxID=600331 RepID=A0ABW3X227_9HYPH|nr:Type II secretion system protein F [Methylobacterium marchantiae]
MPSFTYRAIDPGGRIHSGVMDAGSQAEILEELDRAGLVPIAALAAAGGRARRDWRQWLTPEPRSEEVTALTLDIVMLLKGGVTLSQSLLLLTQMGAGRWQKHVLRDVHAALASGNSLSQALSEHPRLFPPIYVKMVEVAEATGRLEQALTNLAEERQRTERLRKRLVGAISYPVFLIFAAMSAMIFIFVYVIPQFETALEGFKDKLDPSALLVFDASAFLRHNGEVILITMAALVLGLFMVSRVTAGHRLGLRLAFRVPVLRTLFLYEGTLTFCRTLAVLVSNGIDISTTLRLLRDVVRLPTLSREIDAVIADVRKGQRLSHSLATRGVLPAHVVQVLRVGEEAGDLADSARRVAGFYEMRLDAALGRAIAIIGPATMMVVSVMIAWLIISVMTALMSVNDLLK